MISNQAFFRKFWPRVAQAVTGHRADADADIFPLLRRLQVHRGARVLDVPCGFGRHALLLARRGYRVTGVDISPDLLAQAREACSGRSRSVRPGTKIAPGSSPRSRPRLKHTPEFIRGDMRRLRFQRQFDLVLNLFTSFGYFGDHDDQRVLGSFHRVLRPSGKLVVHLINRDWVMRHFRPRGTMRLRGLRLDERVTMDWTTSVIRTEWTARLRNRNAAQRLLERSGKRALSTPKSAMPRGLRGVTYLRIYSAHELARMLEQAGFRQVQVFGGFRGEPLTVDHRWLVLTARK